MAEAIPIIMAIIGAAGLGETIYSQVNKPSVPTPKPVTPAAPSPAEALKTRQNQEAALSSQFPNIQAATGGSLSPDAWVRLAELLTNQAGTPGIGAASQDLLMQLLGKGKNTSAFQVTAGNTPTTTGSTTGLTPGGVNY